MRFIKTLGLALVAVIAATAFVGVGSASATSTGLCNAHPEGAKCKAGTQLGGEVNIDWLSILGSSKLSTSLGDIHCQNVHLKAHIPNANLALSLLGTIKAVEWLSCESLLFGCSGKPASVKATNIPEFHLLYKEPNLGILTILKLSLETEIKCGGIIGTITCKFGENDSLVGTVHNLHEGKAIGVVKFEKAPFTGPGGGLCPKSGTLTTTWERSHLVNGIRFPLFIAT